MVFLIVRSIPGDVIDVLMSEMSELGGTVDRERIMRMLGLDVPVHVQYGRWIGGVLQGDLGVSLRGSVPITPKIVARLPVTFELGLLDIIIGLSISLPIGIYSAIRQNTIGDYAGRGIAVTFISVPTFWTATMVMIYPALWWGCSPISANLFSLPRLVYRESRYATGRASEWTKIGNCWCRSFRVTGGSWRSVPGR